MQHPFSSRWLGPTAWMTAARLVRMAAGIALFAALARTLSPEALGKWMLALGTWGLVETVREGAFGSAYLRWMGVGDDDERPLITGALVQWSVLWALGAGVGGGLVALSLPPGLVRDLVLGFTLVGPLATVSSVLHVILQARRAFPSLFAQQVAQAIPLGMVAGAVVWRSWDGVTWALLGLAAGHALAIAVSIPGLVGVSARFRGTRSMMKRLFRHGRHAASSRAGSALHRSLDLWLVAALAGPAALALYVVAWKLADYAEILLQPFVKVLVPEISAHGRHRPAAVRLAARATVVLTGAIAAASLPLALWPEPCIKLLAGAGYEAAAPLLRTLVVFNLLRPLDRCTGVYLDAIGHPAVNARKVLIALSVNASATVLALVAGGGWALELAAAASVLASLVGVVDGERSMRGLGVPGVLEAMRRVVPDRAPQRSPHGR